MIFFRFFIGTLFILWINLFPVYAVDFQRLSPNNQHPEIWYVPTDTVPTIAMQISFPIGSAFDPDDKLGLAKMVASTMDEGAGDLDSDAFRTALVDKQIDLSYSVSANRFTLNLNFFKFDANKALEIAKLSLNQPRFDTDAIELMRQQLIAGIENSRKQSDTIAHTLLRQDYYKNHVFAKPNLGTLKTLKNITRDDLVAFHKKLTLDNAFISVVGDISESEITAFVTDLLRDLPRKSVVNHIIPDYSPVPQSNKLNVYSDVPQSTIIMATPTIKRNDKAFLTHYLATHILGGGGFGSQLVNNLREKKGLTYSVSAYLDTSLYDGRMVIQFATDNKTVGDALAETDRTLRDLAKNGITMQQLAKAKTNLKGQYVLTFETNNDICGLAQSLYTYGLPFDYTKKRDVLFNAVTLSDVNQVIQKLFTQPLTIITVGGNKEIQNFKSISINDIQF